MKSKVFPDKVKLGDIYFQYEVGLSHQPLLIPDASTWWRRTVGQASEKLLNNYALYLQHELWIKLDKLADPSCPLSSQERHQAYQNIYGNYLRYLLSQIFRFKILKVLRLYHLYPVPLRYVHTLLVKQRRGYFSSFTGSNPMRSLME